MLLYLGNILSKKIRKLLRVMALLGVRDVILDFTKNRKLKIALARVVKLTEKKRLKICIFKYGLLMLMTSYLVAI